MYYREMMLILPCSALREYQIFKRTQTKGLRRCLSYCIICSRLHSRVRTLHHNITSLDEPSDSRHLPWRSCSGFSKVIASRASPNFPMQGSNNYFLWYSGSERYIVQVALAKIASIMKIANADDGSLCHVYWPSPATGIGQSSSVMLDQNTHIIMTESRVKSVSNSAPSILPLVP